MEKINIDTDTDTALPRLVEVLADKRLKELDEAIANPDRRQALIVREFARVLAGYHASAAGRTIGKTEPPPEITPEVLDGFAEWMALNDPAFHAAVDALAHLVEEYVEAGKRLHVRIAERWLYPERETDAQVAAGKTAEAIAARISATQ